MAKYNRECGLLALPSPDALANWIAKSQAPVYPIFQSGLLNAIALFSGMTLATCGGLMALARYAQITYPAHLPINMAFWTMVGTMTATLFFHLRPLYRVQCALLQIVARRRIRIGTEAARETLSYLQEAIANRYTKIEDQTRQDMAECRVLISRVNTARGKIPNAPPHCRTDEFETLRITSARELVYLEHCLEQCKNHAAMLTLHRNGIKESIDHLNARLDIFNAIDELPLKPSNMESMQDSIWIDIEKLASLVNESLVDAECEPLSVALTDWEERMMIAEESAPLLVSSSAENDEHES